MRSRLRGITSPRYGASLVFASPDARIADPSNARVMAISDNRVRECPSRSEQCRFHGRDKKPFNRSPNCRTLVQVRIRKIKRASASLAAMLDTEPSRLSMGSILLAALCPFHLQPCQTVNVYRDMQLGRHRASARPARTVRQIKHPWRIRVGEWMATARAHTRDLTCARSQYV